MTRQNANHRAADLISAAAMTRSGWVERNAITSGVPVRAFARSDAAWGAEVIVGVPLRNQGRSLPACLASIFAQRGAPGTAILILDDGSADGWMRTAAPLLDHPAVVLAWSCCGSAARARNRILEVVDVLFPAARWVARLDADDLFATPDSLASACDAGDRSSAAYVLGGNRLRRGGALLPRANPAGEWMRDPACVVDLLGRMADGSAENELPSCNLLLATRTGLRYPIVASAEDHWLVAGLLMNRGRAGAIVTDPYYCDYTLDGGVTGACRRSGQYLRSRRALHQAALRWALSAKRAEAECC